MIEKFKIMKWNNSKPKKDQFDAPSVQDKKHIECTEEKSVNVDPRFGIYKNGQWVSFAGKSIKDVMYSLNRE